jgi:membrane protein YqaA with SNARE-associated domain
MKICIKKFNNWISEITATKWGSLVLFVFSFADASFLPLPVTTIFLILILLNPQKVARQILSVVGGTLLGAVAGYLFGHFAWLKPNGEFTGIVQFLMHNIPGFSQTVYEKVHILYTKWDYWILSAATITPLPYGMFSIASGAFGINLIVFMLVTFVCQGIKFTFLAFFSLKLSPKLKALTEFNWKPLAIISSIFVLIAFVITRII